MRKRREDDSELDNLRSSPLLFRGIRRHLAFVALDNLVERRRTGREVDRIEAEHELIWAFGSDSLHRSYVN